MENFIGSIGSLGSQQSVELKDKRRRGRGDETSVLHFVL